VVGAKGVSNLTNMIGHNFRLGEIESAIGLEQLKKLKGFVASRQGAAERLTEGLQGLAGLRTPVVKPDCTHAYYVYPMILDVDLLGVDRQQIHAALAAEGVTGLASGYANVHLLPMYQQKMAYGTKGFPWTSDICQRDVDYSKGICPVAEALHDHSFLGFEMCLHELDAQDVDLVVAAFKKVWQQLGELSNYDAP
jgi:dTDP-4-amino-4,6-dideoxygalactose transaminase